VTDGRTWGILETGVLGDEARHLLDTISGGVILQDRRGIAIYANQAALDMIGLTFAEINGTEPIREGWQATDEDGNVLGVDEQPAMTVLRTGERQQVLVGITMPGGERRWLWNEAVAVIGRSGRPELVISSFVDLTNRREIELEREENERRLSFLIEATTVLSESFEYEQTLGRVANLVVPLLADWCAVDIVDADGSARRVASVGALQPPIPEALTSLPVVVRAGKSELHSEVTGNFAGLRSLVVTPLVARGRVVGAVWLGITMSSRRFDIDELLFVEELARRAALAVDNARVYEDRRRVAETLQLSLLPPTLPSIEGVELGAAYRASGDGNDLGGDFYDVFEVGDGTWAAVIGDVCGKGPGAAAMTGLARHTLHAVARRGDPPSRVLSRLNDAIVLEPHEDRFLTAVLCRIEPRADGVRLALARAGHPMPVLRRRDGSVRAIGPPGVLLGSLAHVELTDEAVDLAPGDLVVLYTDGVTEARNREEILGSDRLRELVENCGGLDAQAVAVRIQDAALEFQPGPPRDDVAVLVLRVPER
jgi:PAS domain S-box-containing protein